MQILGVEASLSLLAHWRTLLAPERQPFFLTAAEAQAFASACPPVPRAELRLTPEERDTNTVWAVNPQAECVVWLDRAAWAALPPAQQRQLLRAQVRHGRGNVPLGRHFKDLLPGLPAGRFLWQPKHLTPQVLARVVAQDGHASRHAEVPEEVWEAARPRLPRVRELAATWPHGSAGNCFGAVMGAADVQGAENEWMQRAPFEDFLARRTVRRRTEKGGQDDQPGTLLVWRSERGVEHVAVTLGGGWAFQKAAQTWWTPRGVLPVDVVKRSNRTPGWRLERWHLG